MKRLTDARVGVEVEGCAGHRLFTRHGCAYQVAYHVISALKTGRWLNLRFIVDPARELG